MKIASYNLWDNPAGMPHRQVQIADTLKALHTDILCLQEDCGTPDIYASLPNLPHIVRHGEGGLTTMSRYPITEHRLCPHALAAVIFCESKTLCVVNLHLPWKSALAREEAIVSVSEEAKALCADYTFFAGDFNCSDTSSVHRFLCGEQSLCGHDAYCFDLAQSYATQSMTTPEPTLAFRENPRWGIVDPPNTLEKNERFDRIYLANPYPKAAPVLHAFGVFGKEISEETRLAPSDHWGVYACLDFDEKS